MKTFYILVLLLFTLNGFSQKKKSGDDAYSSPKLSLMEMSVQADKNQLNRVINCLDAYQKERNLAYAITLIGVSVGVYYASVAGKANSAGKEIETAKKVAPVVSGILILGGVFAFIDADKWLSKRNLIFTGAKLSYRF